MPSIDDVRKRAVFIYKSSKDTHESAFLSLQRIMGEVGKKPDLKQIVDATAMLKKSEELIKDLRKELNSTLRKLQKVGCMLFLREGLVGESCKTEWASAYPDTKTIPPIPNRHNDPEGYRKFAEHFGVPEDLIASGAFKPHWPSLVDYVTSAESNGRSLPPGIDPAACTTEYTLVCRFNKDTEPDKVVDDVMNEDPYSYPMQEKT